MTNIIKKGHLITCFIRSIYFNVRNLPFSQAIKCPILLGLHTHIHCAGKYKIEILGTTRFGMVSIGVTNGSFEMGSGKVTKIIIKENGKLSFSGSCNFSSGGIIVINAGGTLHFGNHIFMNANALINTGSTINIGDDFIGGWNISLLDGDGHDIVNLESNKTINEYRPINIGNHCWISANTAVLKGVSLANDTIVPYGSVITKSTLTQNTIFGCSPNRALKTNVKRVN